MFSLLQLASDTSDSSASTAIQNAPQTSTELIADLGVRTIYLMGFSFILGCLFTVFVLLVLDFMRRNASKDQ